MYDNILDYFAQKSQTTINEYILKVNSHRKKLRESGKFTLSKVSDLRNTHLYSNKPQTIKTIREESTKDFLSHLTITVATSIQQNMKLETHDTSLQKPLYENVSEVFWGNINSILDSVDQRSLFIYNLFTDLRNHPKFGIVINQALMRYTPYAVYVAMEYVCSKEDVDPMLIDRSYKHEHIDLWGEAIYHFTLSSTTAEEIIKIFFEFLEKEYAYESRDYNGRYSKKKAIVSFGNFEKAISNNIDKILKPLLNLEFIGTTAYHIYNLTIESALITHDLISSEISTSIETLERCYTASEEQEYSVKEELVEKTDQYIEDLLNIENRLNGKIFDYVETVLFQTKKSHLFSELRAKLRLEEKIEEEQEKMVEEYLKQQKIAEEAAMEAAMKVFLHRQTS